MTRSLKLGLIGDNIAASRAPELHRAAGGLAGVAVTYDRLVPAELRLDFDATFDLARHQGYDGLNITYPYKERVVRRVGIADPAVTRMGAVNTVLFRGDPVGHNTDSTGFSAAFRAGFDGPPGDVGMIGAGGVGRAIAFALSGLGARSVTLFDTDAARARALADDLGGLIDASVASDVAELARGRTGLVNSTPVGMVGYPGTPVPRRLIGAAWAFDAVYTPRETLFLKDAARAGARVIQGFELFFWQGLQAWELFSNRPIPSAELRRALDRPEKEKASDAPLA